VFCPFVDEIAERLEEIFMALADDLRAALDQLLARTTEVDMEVEVQLKALTDAIQTFTDNGITSELANDLLTRIGLIRTAMEKVPTDDADLPAPPSPPPGPEPTPNP
jgi:hypothetical protein